MKLCTLLVILILTVNAERYNIVFILTDDQDLLLNGMIPMTKTQEFIANEGCTFQNAFVNTPICCPSRSTILTGKYIHNTGVYNNSIEGNCAGPRWQNIEEKTTIATYLKYAGNYTTFYAGKYLNQYGEKNIEGIHHVPPGYDWWIGLKGNSKYYNYTLSINGTKREFSNEYFTDVITNYTLNFLENWDEDNPFFMMLAPPASHAPFTPAPRHANRFPKAKALRTSNFNVADNNKHWLVKMQPSPLPEPLDILDEIQRKRLQSLLAVDDLVEAVVFKLTELKVIDKTVIIFTSDNGYHIGQFSLPWDKRQPYDTDIRVPFLIRAPHLPKKRLLTMPISTVDFAPSILTYAQLPVPIDMDGQSFIDPNFKLKNDAESKKILVEYFGEHGTSSVDENCPWKYDSNLTECSLESWCKCQDAKNNTYACIVDIDLQMNFKYCQFKDDVDFVEAYDLVKDPYELNNIYTSMDPYNIRKYEKFLEKLTTCAGKTCSEI